MERVYASVPTSIRFPADVLMRAVVPAKGTTRLKQIAQLWPYILIAMSLVGLVLRFYRGTF
jgi:hypothetical protein